MSVHEPAAPGSDLARGPGSDLAREPGPGRLEAFSDGVIAIALTLLVLEVGIPQGPGSLLDRLAGQWPVYGAVVVSFVVVGASWLSHHALIADVRRTDHGLLVLNLILLFVICAVPFPTKVVGEEILSPDLADQRTAAILYGATFFVLGMAFNAVWQWAIRHRLLHDHVAPGAVAVRTRVYLAGPVAYAVSTALAFVHPLLSIAATALVGFGFLFPLPTRHSERPSA